MTQAAETAQADEAAAATDDAGTDATTGNLAQLVSELPPAPVGFPTADEVVRPTRLSIESLGIDDAPIIGVGVEAGGAMEIPPADEVGWYRYSPTPGQDGSSILAAHIAYDGQNGVFVQLADVAIGAEVEVVDEQGQIQRFAVEAVDRYDKEALPEDLVFARDGEPRLILVTCGGAFDRVANSYEDNVVVTARPLAPE